MAAKRALSVVADYAAIRNIWCVGRNYAEHAKELGNAVPSKPMIFLKAGSCILPPNQPLILPKFSKDVHHEVELAIQFGPDLSISHAAVALDLTARDVQSKLKEKQFPWTLAKSFPHSCPLGPFFPTDDIDLQDLNLHLVVNGSVRQSGFTKDMIFPVPELVSYVREHFPVVPGDIVLTGTPAGVSQIKVDDVIEANVNAGGKILSAAKWEVASV